MASSCDSQVFTELTPVQMVNADNDQTDVKAPVSNFMDTAYQIKKEVDIDNNSGATEFSDNYEGNLDTSDQPEHVLYARLQTLFRGLPKEMFINRVLHSVAFSESDLESHRSMLFDLIKECEDFPYGLQAELKRRVHTRNGDTVATKHAQDIYSLMSVLEGGEYSELKDLLARGSRGQRPQSQSQTPYGAGNVTLTSCDCAVEIKSLVDSLNNVKADVLNVKQGYIATETSRSSQIQSLKSTVIGLKSDLNTLTSTVSKAVTDIVLAAQRIESDKSLGVASLRAELRLLKDSIRDIQDVMDTNTYGASPRNTLTASKSKKTVKKSKFAAQRRSLFSNDNMTTQNEKSAQQPAGKETVEQISVEAAPHVDGNVQSPGITDDCNHGVGNRERLTAAPVLPSAHSNATTSDLGLGHDAQGAQGFGYDFVGTGSAGPSGGDYPVDDQTKSLVNTDGVSRSSTLIGASVGLNANFPELKNHFPQPETQHILYSEAVMSPNISGRDTLCTNNVSANRGSSIPVHIANNSPSELDAFVHRDEYDDENDADFAKYVKKKAKRYYLGGFVSSITWEKIARYVNRRGPSVSFIRIWHSRRNARNIVIRLNVEDNEFADLVESPTFWPRGVTCRPWRNRNEENRNERNRNRGTTDRSSLYREWVHSYDPRGRQIYGRSDIDDYNPYSPLRDQVNLD